MGHAWRLIVGARTPWFRVQWQWGFLGHGGKPKRAASPYSGAYCIFKPLCWHIPPFFLDFLSNCSYIINIYWLRYISIYFWETYHCCVQLFALSCVYAIKTGPASRTQSPMTPYCCFIGWSILQMIWWVFLLDIGWGSVHRISWPSFWHVFNCHNNTIKGQIAFTAYYSPRLPISRLSFQCMIS